MTRPPANSFTLTKKKSTFSKKSQPVDPRLIKDLNFLYPEPRSELDFTNDFQLLVAVVLSAQCTDKKVNQVTPRLFSQYPNFQELAKSRLEDIETIIRPINYYRTKAKNLQTLSQIVTDRFNGMVPRTDQELQSLPGVGQKTSNVVLGEMKVQPTLAVDTHVFRVSRRLGLTSGKKPAEVERDLKELFPPELWRNLHHWLILHGRRICKAQRPLCSTCLLVEYCPFGDSMRVDESKLVKVRSATARAKRLGK